MSGTQSGRPEPVKQNNPAKSWLSSIGAVALTIMTISACAAPSGGWFQPVKNAELTEADYRSCRTQAEEASLEVRQEQRSGYGVFSTERPGVFNPRGDDPMAIAERSGTVSLFDALVSACMAAKGYRRDRPDDP